MIMRWNYQYVFIFCLFSLTLSAQEIKLKKLTPEKVLDELIQYYDPEDRWAHFKGSVLLYTVRPDGQLISEDIHLDNQMGVYQSFAYQNDSILMRRWDKGTMNYSLNGKTNLSQQSRKQLKLDFEHIQLLKRRHLIELGYPMTLKSLGIKFKPKIKETNFNGKPCFLLVSTGVDAANEEAYPFLKNPVNYYINIDDFSFAGMEFPAGIREWNLPQFRVVFNQFIEVDRIKIPYVKTYYRLKGDEYLFSTTIHEFSRHAYVDEEQEKRAITDVLTAETYFFGKRNFEKWVETWSHSEDVVHCFASREGYSRNEGWEAVSRHIQEIFNTYPGPEETPIIERTNYVFHIHGNVAWVYFDSREWTSYGRHQRILRKEHGKWKLVHMTGINEASYTEEY